MFLQKIRKALWKRRTKNIFNEKAVIPSDAILIAGASCKNDGPRDRIVIGEHCTLGAEFISLYGGKITVGENTYIGPGTSIQAKEHINIGKNVIIANNVILLDNNNHPTDPEMRLRMSACKDFINDELWSWKYADSAPVTVEDNVWIGRDARILKGVTVGKGSIVALGAIVTHDVPPYSIVAGNPAKVVKTIKNSENSL